MNSLKIPDGGVLLAASEPKPSIPQAFHLRLDSSLIESIIHASQNGDDLRLALGKTPTLQYGSKSHRISPPTDSAEFDLFLTKPFESTREAVRIASTTSLFQKPRQAKSRTTSLTQNEADAKIKSSSSHKSSISSGLDSDLEVINGASAPRGIARDRPRIAGKLPDSKRASAQSRPPKPISDYGSKANSLPASPGLNPVQSPSLGLTLTASQQAMERAKEQRFTLVHELAVQDYPLSHLKGKWAGKDGEFRLTLEKVADYNTATEKWALRRMYLKELDPWKYDYNTKEERQKAIDNAVKQFDKQRLSAQEPEWQKLLPKEERNKGICLSRLQANLAKGPAQNGSVTKNGKAEDSSMSGDGLESDRPKAIGESMSRSNSNSLPSKPKKASAQDAQAKRLLGTSKAKPAAPPKVSPKKTKLAATKANGRPALSKEIIENSDSSDDERLSAQAKSLPKPKATATTTNSTTNTTTTTATATTTTTTKPASSKPATTTKTKDTVVVAARRPPIKAPAPPTPVKRPLDDDDSSSSSGTPLSKRIKQKHPLPAPKVNNHRPSDASVTSSRSAAGLSSSKPKNTSPAKSSPLASSPPTNASDLESEELQPAMPKKRRIEPEVKPTAAKKRTSDVSSEILNKANKFKQFYQQYEALHYEILALDHPSDEKLANLLDLRGRLETMKREIYKDCSPA
ncbi:hypothetical protein ESCO_000296 [Escovopsis weberi]|uniref:Uncharacterized protein n=1 Tax=Escovopsis weberi TaxID=150374 RepID=A0A0M9VU02_ESCWE|nr:hypothetical protein ESCO_000296 [Escovopsis weberi]